MLNHFMYRMSDLSSSLKLIVTRLLRVGEPMCKSSWPTLSLMIVVLLIAPLASADPGKSDSSSKSQHVDAPIDADESVNHGEVVPTDEVNEVPTSKGAKNQSGQAKDSSTNLSQTTEVTLPTRKRINSTRRIIKKRSKLKKRKRRFPKNRPKRALKSPPALGKIPFPLGEQLTFKVNMLNAHSGTVVLKVGRRGKYRNHPAVELSGFVRSSPFLENFYPIRDSLSVLVDERNFLPLKSEFYLKEKDRQIEYLSEFDDQKGQIKWKKKRLVKGKERFSKLTYDSPASIYNVLSSLYALRRLPLKVGMSFEQYVWDGQRERLIMVEVIGEEQVITEMGRFEAFKIKIKGRVTGGIISRKTLKRPPEEGFIWISKDAYRTPLRAVTPTKLGQAEAVLSARAVNPE